MRVPSLGMGSPLYESAMSHTSARLSKRPEIIASGALAGVGQSSQVIVTFITSSGDEAGRQTLYPSGAPPGFQTTHGRGRRGGQVRERKKSGPSLRAVGRD